MSNSNGVRDTKYAFRSYEKIENEPSDRPPVPHDVWQCKVNFYYEDDGIASYSSQGAQPFKLKNPSIITNRHGAIINMGDRHLFSFSGGEGMSTFSGNMPNFSYGMPKFYTLSVKYDILSPMSMSKSPIQRSSPSMEHAFEKPLVPRPPDVNMKSTKPYNEVDVDDSKYEATADFEEINGMNPDANGLKSPIDMSERTPNSEMHALEENVIIKHSGDCSYDIHDDESDAEKHPQHTSFATSIAIDVADMNSNESQDGHPSYQMDTQKWANQ